MTVDEVVAVIAPNFVGDSRLSGAISLASDQHSRSALGVRWAEVIANHACHVLTMSDRANQAGTSGTGAVGPVTAKSTGPQSITYSGPSLSGDLMNIVGDLAQTQFGLRVIGLTQIGFGFPEVIR